MLSAGPQPPSPSFEEFLDGVRAEAIARGIAAATIDRAFDGLAPEPTVVARDRHQPEATMSLDGYVGSRVTAAVVAKGREQVRLHQSVLERVETAFGVPPAVMTAIWGVESNFGRFTGTYPTVKALATLAFDARRPLFRTELLNALEIVDRGTVPLEALKGSWAGAMGQPQFMPSSFLAHAVDFDGDGSPNIWTSIPDVFASMANYLRAGGWSAGQRWGREVSVPLRALNRIDREVPMRTSGCRALRELTVERPLVRWGELGVTLSGGGSLPAAPIEASLVRGRKRYFLVYSNYAALLSYNCSNAYAVSVGLLSDRIGSS